MGKATVSNKITLLLTASLKGKNMQHCYVVDYSLTGKHTSVSYTVTKLLA